ncbi:MAG: PilZ domain protein [Novosphingobium sp.]|nr:PilZ domain protein [Novosphingobium sp.]
MLTDIPSETGILEALGSAPGDRRGDHRIKTVYRLVKVEHDEDEGLARCRNLSDGGVKLDLAMPLDLNDRVTIGFSSETQIAGRVIWLSGDSCGVAFDEPIDSSQLLRSDMIANSQRLANQKPRNRSPRLKTNLPAKIAYYGTTRNAVVKDVSVRGMKIANDGNFHPGLNVRVILADGREKEGVVRWSRDNIAGVLLLDPFGVEELGSVHRLCGPDEAEAFW